MSKYQNTETERRSGARSVMRLRARRRRGANSAVSRAAAQNDSINRLLSNLPSSGGYVITSHRAGGTPGAMHFKYKVIIAPLVKTPPTRCNTHRRIKETLWNQKWFFRVMPQKNHFWFHEESFKPGFFKEQCP